MKKHKKSIIIAGAVVGLLVLVVGGLYVRDLVTYRRITVNLVPLTGADCSYKTQPLFGDATCVMDGDFEKFLEDNNIDANDGSYDGKAISLTISDPVIDHVEGMKATNPPKTIEYDVIRFNTVTSYKIVKDNSGN